MKATLDKQVNQLVRTTSSQPKKKRDEFTLEEWALVESEFEACVEAANLEVFGVPQVAH
jgi:hypothetical protein